MINHKHGNYKCDYCSDEIGEFLTATGNHPICEENATLKEALRLAREANEDAVDIIRQIDGWSRAYPLEMFPESDVKKAQELLAVGGQTVDSISAAAIRHAVKAIERQAREALAILEKATS